MAIYRDWNALPEFKNAVITIGSFDGVHLGHQEILKKLANLADKYDGESVLITFHPHPRKIIDPYAKLALLSEEEQKLQQILDLGIDNIVLVPFTRDFSLWSAEDYIDDFLIKKFKPKAIVLGYDHHFGHDRKGNLNLLKEKVPNSVEVVEIEAQLINEAAISSTKIRNAILNGDIKNVSLMLGRQYGLHATVVHGKKLGRKLGFPTANLNPVFPDLILPANGVYMVKVNIEDKDWAGMMNIGVKPTVENESVRSLEVHILDFEEDIYGKTIHITFLDKIREEQKFENIAALIEQLKKDKKWVEANYN
ncbi:MAG TPA: bifunctional riboflavin kinase/FAD synthetase [Chitinophagaceae bacterium]|nr:bifunctional riboflavin kinase/FAD synthetase [Chitinophagaceae bacterium]